ncbi:MAG TPA: dTMP kinase [Stellaceae bacterium]|nr:dTMP kinase [Stellaceae bacterium]
MTSRGRLIAFEGGEGAGKSTQIKLLADHLAEQGIAALATREPGGTPEGQELRRLLLGAGGAEWRPMAETLLMVADRAQHIERVIAPALAAGQTVLTDRFVGSTLAYQGAGRGVSGPFIRGLHRDACGDLWPDLTIVLDLDPRVGLARSRRRLAASGSDEARFEALDLAFHERVREAFLDLASAPGPAVVIDASRPVEEVAATVRTAVAGLFGE